MLVTVLCGYARGGRALRLPLPPRTYIFVCVIPQSLLWFYWLLPKAPCLLRGKAPLKGFRSATHPLHNLLTRLPYANYARSPDRKRQYFANSCHAFQGK